MSAIPIVPDDDQVQRQRGIPLAQDPQAPVIALPPGAMPPLSIGRPQMPMATSIHGKSVIPQTPGHAIPINSETGKPEALNNKGIPMPMDPQTGQAEPLNNKGIPIRAGVAGLWAKADNIQNPAVRVLAKIGAGAARAIDIAGAAALPSVEAKIPGSVGYEKAQTDRARALAEDQANTDFKKAETANIKSETEARENPQPKTGTAEEQTLHDLMAGENGAPRVNPDTQKPYTFLEAYEATKNAGQNAPKGVVHDTDQGLIMVHPDGTATPLMLGGKPIMGKGGNKNTSEQIKSKIQQAFEKGDTATVKTLQNELKAIDPEGAQRIQIALGNQDIARGNASRRDIRDHDKAYVQPAEAVEKSYQMMDHAYQEYEAARKAGKELPTGAQSMLALSTHLATTFGNVKGARVTKDMIEHHLGARSISDDALVAVQKLTNGDTLSPAQWTAFHQLVGQSRKESWQIATKEAKRKDIPIDFLPEDLQGLNGGKQESGAPPAGAKVRDYSHL